MKPWEMLRVCLQPLKAGWIPAAHCCQGNTVQPCSLSTLQKIFMKECALKCYQKKNKTTKLFSQMVWCLHMFTHPGPGLGKWFFQLKMWKIDWKFTPPQAAARATTFSHVFSRRWEDVWEVSERARDPLWEVFLSEQLFRQLVLRRTLSLSSSQLLNPLLPSPTPVLSATLSLYPFVHWPVSWRRSDGWRWGFRSGIVW